MGDMMHRFVVDELEKIGFDMSIVESSLSALEVGESLRNLLKDSSDKYILVFK